MVGRGVVGRVARSAPVLVAALLTSTAYAQPNEPSPDEPSEEEPSEAPVDEATPESGGSLVYDLSYEAAVGCPDRAAFIDLVIGRTGRNPFTDDASPEVDPTRRRVTIRIEETPTELRALRAQIEIWTAGPVPHAAPIRRELNAPNGRCESLAAAAATTVGIAIDPVVVPDPPEPPPAPPPKPPPPPPKPPPPKHPQKKPPPPPSPPEPGVRFRATADVLGSAAVGPGPTIGGAVGVGVAWPVFALTAQGRVESTFGHVELDSGDDVSAVLLSAGPSACVKLSLWIGCGTFHLGAFQGSASTVADPDTNATFYARGALGTGVQAPLTDNWDLRGLLEVGVPVVRTALIVDDRTVWTAPPLQVTVSLGAVLSAP